MFWQLWVMYARGGVDILPEDNMNILLVVGVILISSIISAGAVLIYWYYYIKKIQKKAREVLNKNGKKTREGAIIGEGKRDVKREDRDNTSQRAV